MIKKREPGRVGASKEGNDLLRNTQKSKNQETEKEWTYEEIADKVGFSVDTVKRFFNGHKVYTDNAKKIIEILGLEFSDVVDLSQSNIVNSQTKDSKTPSKQLKEALYQLNYKDLDGLFETSLKKRSVQGFLIQGKYGYGQKWLVSRLARHINYNVIGYKADLPIENKQSIDDFWYTLGNKIGCQPNPEAIAQQIYQYWLTQPVILAIWNFNNVAKGKGLEIFINQVWQLVVNLIHQDSSSDSSRQAILFIVDQTGNLQLSSDFIINLPEINDLDPDDITLWVRQSLSKLLIELNNDSILDIEYSIQDIIEKNTIPFFALQAICERCKLNYSDIEGSFTL